MSTQNLPTPPSKVYWEDTIWANQHYGELLKSHPNQWVAVHNQQVVAANPDGRKVEGILRAQYPGIQIPLVFVSDASHIY